MINLELFLEEKKPKKSPKPEKAKENNHSFYTFIVKAFLVDEKKTTFIFQYKQAKKLFAEIPEKRFWQWLVGEGRKIYSLKEWLKPEQIQLLKHLNKKRKLNLPTTKKHKLEKQSFGENKNELKVKRNLISFTDDEQRKNSTTT
jgi:hypothetical protein